jgi:hypothetical protein
MNMPQTQVTKNAIPVLVVTNPLWIELFGRGWEDLDWGKGASGQHAVAKAVHQLAAVITDVEIRKEIQRGASKLMLNTAQELLKEAESLAE